jgi:hypothetical protein
VGFNVVTDPIPVIFCVQGKKSAKKTAIETPAIILFKIL